MPRLFVANLHFEQQIAGDRQNLPMALRRRAAEQACHWLAVAEQADVIWCPEPVAAGYWERMAALGLPCVTGISTAADVSPGLQLVPWGWSTSMLRFARPVRARCEAPPPEAVRTANSRRFAWELETAWGVGIDGAVALTSQSGLDRALRQVAVGERWVLKSEFGAAARQRIVGTGSHLDRTAAGWIRKRLMAGEWLVFEPWLERVAEAGLQWTIPRTGAPVLEGVTELLADSSGQYVGSRFGLDRAALETWQPAVDIGRQAIAEIQRLGYFGPVGIDAMRYRTAEGSVRIRPLQDINARWTMGRLALGWRRLMPSGIWRHGTPEEFAGRSQRDARLVRTSPATVGDQPAGTVAWVEPC